MTQVDDKIYFLLEKIKEEPNYNKVRKQYLLKMREYAYEMEDFIGLASVLNAMTRQRKYFTNIDLYNYFAYLMENLGNKKLDLFLDKFYDNKPLYRGICNTLLGAALYNCNINSKFRTDFWHTAEELHDVFKFAAEQSLENVFLCCLKNNHFSQLHFDEFPLSTGSNGYSIICILHNMCNVNKPIEKIKIFKHLCENKHEDKLFPMHHNGWACDKKKFIYFLCDYDFKYFKKFMINHEQPSVQNCMKMYLDERQKLGSMISEISNVTGIIPDILKICFEYHTLY